MIFNSNITKVITLLVAAMLIFCIVDKYICNNKNHEDVIVIDTIITTIIDTLIIEKNVYVPEVIYRDTTIADCLVASIDTMAIIRSFFSKNVVIDTIHNDSNLFLSITDTLMMNRIISRFPKINFYPRTKIVTNTITINNPGKAFYAGITFGGNSGCFGIGPSIIYQPNHKYLLGTSYDLVNKSATVSILIRPFKPP